RARRRRRAAARAARVCGQSRAAAAAQGRPEVADGSPFTDPVWLAEVRAWVEQQVTVTGEIEQPHLRVWGTVLSVPTTDGVVWFKAAREAFAYEARVLEVLVPLAPDLLPEILAVRPEA